MRIPSTVSDQLIYFVAVDATDFTTRETGLSSFTVYRSRNGGTATAMTTPTVTEVDATNMPGVYKLLCDEDMTLDAGDQSQEMCFHITHAGMAPVTRTIEIYRPTVSLGNTISVSGARADCNVKAISDDTTAADNCEAFFDGTGYAGTNNVIPSVTTVTGNVNGSVGSVTGAVGSVTGNVGGIAGTINTLDELDTAQDTQHSTTRTLIGTPSDLGGGADLATNLSDMAGATFSTSTDSQEAIRNRGDAAWTTGAGGSDRLLMVDTTIATLASQTSFTLTAGSADDDAYNGCTIVIEDASTSTQKATGIVSDYTGSTKTVTLLYDPGVFIMATSDKVYILAERGLKANSASNWFVNLTNAGLVDSNPKRWDDTLIASTSPFDAVALETSVQGLVTTVGAAGAGLTEAGGTGDHLTAIPWNASWDAEVQSECADALTAFGWTSITISAVSGAVGSVTGNVGGSVASVTGAVGSVTGNVTGSVGSLAAQAKADVNAEVDDVLNTDATTEPTSAPAATASLGTKIGWVFARLRNKLTQTATTEILFQDDTTTTLSTSTHSDDGTTYTRGEHS